MSCFSFFIFYLLSSTKLKNRRVEQVLHAWGDVGIHGRGEVAGKRGRRMNMVQIMCTHECKYKNDTC
jgi:hypothetical protein